MIKRPQNIKNKNLVYWARLFKQCEHISNSKGDYSKFRTGLLERGFSEFEINKLIRLRSE